MLNLVIVEDENIVRLGLSTIVNWEEHGFHVAGLFRNGREALDFVKANDVDIVITDIRMPVMDGETLVREIMSFTDTIDILVLSNFDDFEIVRNCFKMGVSDYILKNEIEPDSLLKVLCTMTENRKKKLHNKKNINEKQRIKLFFSDLREVNFVCTDTSIIEKYGSQIRYFEDKIFFAVEMSVVYENDGRFYTGKNPEKSVIWECVRENTGCYFEDLVIMEDSGKYLILIWIDCHTDESELQSRIKKWQLRICSMIKEYFNLKVLIGISSFGKSVYELSEAHEEAVLSNLYLFYYPECQCLEFTEYLAPFQDENSFFKCLKEVRFCCEFNNFKILEESLENFYNSLKCEKNVRPDRVCMFSQNILQEIDYFLMNNTEIRLQNLEPDWQVLLNTHYCTIDSLKNFIFTIIDKVVEYLKSYEKNYELIAKAKRIISREYSGNISLQYMSEILNVNPAYFSTLFKKKTGSSFIQYLTAFRMKKAIELLRTTDYSVEKIAEEVGYSNPNYFVKVFKKQMGKTISDFRKNGI